MCEVVLVDYGCGNIRSIEQALVKIGVSCRHTSNPIEIKEAKRIILPGVGAYATGMQHLEKMELIQVLKDFAISGKPMLGICLGMQLLLDYSEEFGKHEGLGIISGNVTYLSSNDGVKIPHIGWNALEIPECNNKQIWDNEILDGIDPNKDCYFVHSYMVRTSRDMDNIAETEYGGVRFSSVVCYNNVYGCQFHPEKSGAIGLKFLNNFVQI